MNNFNLYNPVNLCFGKDEHRQLSSLIPKDAKVLITYGGGSIKQNGVYEKVKGALKNHEVLEFGGIEPNPQYSTLLRALAIIKAEKIDFLLAVGGGSVIDGTKFLASAALFEGEEPWDILAKGIRTTKALPFGTVLTLPATGSEMNSGAVVSRKEIGQKRGMGGPGLFPQFSISDPTVVASIPQRQLANGLVDAFTHVMEQYMTYPTSATLQDRISEGILSTLIEIAPKLMNNPSDYGTAANFMWSCNMALNGLIQKGVPTDWSIHAIGHEITAAYNVDHARTLAIVLPSLYRFKFEQKQAKLAQYGRRVLSLEGTDFDVAHEAIDRTEDFFHSLGIKTKLGAYTTDAVSFPERAAAQLESYGATRLGEHKDITPADVITILNATL
ncbi:MAG: iron-containing alcohol dehydrogenase [Schleiferiaceae bacterium]|nr:iron-containing alcohol dehydrogenase [Schleiferiaceae bacterium]MDP4876873.1 iron-containing alcohol dehydrogenase [Schleiferiaceae bacterium]MDP4958400.1 iron-containing alcohol dehydrogenase [Schleiferiaceae bacterium]